MADRGVLSLEGELPRTERSLRAFSVVPPRPDDPDPDEEYTLAPAIDEEIGEEELEQIKRTLNEEFAHLRDLRAQWIEPVWAMCDRARRGLKPSRKGAYKADPPILRECFRQAETVKPHFVGSFMAMREEMRYPAPERELEEQFRRKTALVLKQARTPENQRQRRQAYENVIDWGTAYLHTCWGWHKQQKRKIDRIWWKGGDSKYRNRRERQTVDVYKPGPVIESLMPQEVYCDPFCEEAHDSPFCFIQRAVTAPELKRMARDGMIDQDAMNAYLEQDACGSGNSVEDEQYHPEWPHRTADDSATRGLYELKHCYTNDGWEYVLLEGDVILRACVNPYGRAPIQTFRNYPQQGLHHGLPEVYCILEEQKILNDLMGMWVDTYHFALSPMFKVRGSAVKSWNTTTFRPGGKIELMSANDDVAPLEVRDTTAQLAGCVGMIKNEMKLTTGINDQLSGAGDAAGTATASTQQLQAATKRLWYKTFCNTPPTEAFWQQLYRLNAEHFEEDEHVRVDSPEGGTVWEQVKPEDFEGEDEVEVELANMREPKEQVTPRLLQTLQMLYGTGAAAMHDMPQVWEMFWAAMGVRRPRSMLANPHTAQADALREFQILRKHGTIKPPGPHEKHAMHLQLHQMQMNDPWFQTVDPNDPVYMAFLDHVNEHASMLEQEQQSAAAQQPGMQGMTPQANGPSAIDQQTEEQFMNGMSGAGEAGAMQESAA